MIVKHKFLNSLILLVPICAIIVLIPSNCFPEIVHPTAEVGFTLSSSSNKSPNIGNNAIFKQTDDHHQRRWRRDKSQKKLENLGYRSVRSKSLHSQGGRVLMEKMLPEEAAKPKNFLEKIKQTILPTTRHTYKIANSKIQRQQLRLALEMVLAILFDQLIKKKELLKTYLYIEHALLLAKDMSTEEKHRLKNAESLLKVYKLSKNKPRIKNQKNYVEEVKKDVEKITETKRGVKRYIKILKTQEKLGEMFWCASLINWSVRKNSSPIYDKLMEWEDEKVAEWDGGEMTLWWKKNSKENPFYHDAFPTNSQNEKGKKKKQSVEFVDNKRPREVSNFLQLDAALDRKARKMCLEVAFAVPLQNWISIADGLTNDEIKDFFVSPLKGFHGLEISFVPSGEPNLFAAQEFDKIEKGNFYTEIWHGIKARINLLGGYKERKEEVQNRIAKCNNELLKAMSIDERKRAMECIKIELLFEMILDAMFENAKADINELKAKVKTTKKIATETKVQNKLHHSRSTTSARRRRAGRAISSSESDDSDVEDHTNCKTTQKMIESKKKLKEAQSDLYSYKKSLNKSLSFRSLFNSMRKSKKSDKPGERIDTFVHMLQNFLKSDTANKNKNFMEKLKKIVTEAENKIGNAEMTGSKALNMHLDKQARLMFARLSGQVFLRNMVDLSQWMTAQEVLQCAQQFRNIRGFYAKNTAEIEANGKGSENRGGGDDSASNAGGGDEDEEESVVEEDEEEDEGMISDK